MVSFFFLCVGDDLCPFYRKQSLNRTSFHSPILMEKSGCFKPFVWHRPWCSWSPVEKMASKCFLVFFNNPAASGTWRIAPEKGGRCMLQDAGRGRIILGHTPPKDAMAAILPFIQTYSYFTIFDSFFKFAWYLACIINPLPDGPLASPLSDSPGPDRT